jgi:hypothetical protein
MPKDTSYEETSWTSGGEEFLPNLFPAQMDLPSIAAAPYALQLVRGVKVVGISHIGYAPLKGFFESEQLTPNDPYRICYAPRNSRYRSNDDAANDPSVVTVSELAELLTEINNLAFQEESDEFGLLRPSYHGLTCCLKAILALARESELIRPTDVDTDRNGDIRIRWAAGEREAELIFPSAEDEQPYLYHSSSPSYGTETDLSAKTVSKRVRWVISGRYA